MKIQNKLYEIYNDVIKEKFGSQPKFRGKKRSLYSLKNIVSCYFCSFNCKSVNGTWFWQNPLNDKWFSMDNRFTKEHTMTEVNLYTLGLSDDQQFDTPEEAFEYAKENGL